MSHLYYPGSNAFPTFVTQYMKQKQQKHERSKSPRNQSGIRL